MKGNQKNPWDFINAKLTLCWSCQNACGGCSWSEYDPKTGKIKFEPVPGWEAIPTKISMQGRVEKIGSYRVIKCPLYVPDPPREEAPLGGNDRF